MRPISNSVKDDLETHALYAFGGAVRNDIKNGFRIVRSGEQIAAIYWSDNEKDNDIEIAVCEGRLTDHYSMIDVVGWLDKQKEKYPRPCNVHKHGSNWPIFGLVIGQTKDFLKQCARLRKGLLPSDELADIESRRPSNALRAELAALRPSMRKAVIDLVASAGISTAPWHIKKDGSHAVRPRSNPAYCYNWAFGGDEEPIAVCLWYSSMFVREQGISIEQNSLSIAEQLEAVTEDDEEEPETRLRARSQAERARNLAAKLRLAWEKQLPIRVIVVDGLRRPAESLGKQSSTVALRTLDSNSWRVGTFDNETGTATILRLPKRDFETPMIVQETSVAEVSAPETPRTTAQAQADHALLPQSERYVDQYTVHAESGTTRREVTRNEYERSRPVRDSVLRRASGACEYCGQRGFLLPSGALFLETHHVIPLSEDGQDNERNVIALCANDHREVHYGSRASELRKAMTERLTLLYRARGESAQ
ncbi:MULTISPECIES: HNH endonuclease [Achromobacter]|uniref:HNH endonuclease n=1 Tax=Achromobacter sp. K91 TaxID=2292262 RepID=UPI001314042C|nr:HNH endonuclease [Achromobacter sp. K91]